MGKTHSSMTAWFLLTLAGAMSGGLGAAPPPGSGGTGKSPAEILSDLVPEPRTEVLVLATTHLRNIGDAWNPRLVESLNRCLVRFAPQVVVVESMPPWLIEGLEKLGGNYAEVVRAMAARPIALGGLAQRELSMTRSEAESAAANLLSRLDGMKEDEREMARRRLACLFSAAYDLPSAVLQWSYLSPEVRRGPEGLPPEVHQFLQEALTSPNETWSIAVEVARRSGLQRIASMDDHSEAAETLEYWSQLSDELDASPIYQELKQSAFYADSDRRFRQAMEAGDLLPHYLWLASPEFSEGDVRSQWGTLLRVRLESRLDRARLAQWEVRNLRMAAHIRQAASRVPGGRVLVVVGAGHKAYLDQYLSQLYDIRLVPLSAVAGAGH